MDAAKPMEVTAAHEDNNAVEYWARVIKEVNATFRQPKYFRGQPEFWPSEIQKVYNSFPILLSHGTAMGNAVLLSYGIPQDYGKPQGAAMASSVLREIEDFGPKERVKAPRSRRAAGRTMGKSCKAMWKPQRQPLKISGTRRGMQVLPPTARMMQ